MGAPTYVAFCPRCQKEGPVVRPWPGWRVARLVWFGALGLALLLFPILSADYCVMLPSFMTLVAAGGPLHWLAGQKVTCRRCRLEVG